MSETLETPGVKNSSYWQRFERLLLILTFFCTLVATVYSVRTSQKAIDQASSALRPWIAIQGIDTFFEEDHMETRFKIMNIGQIPAYMIMEIEGHYENKKLPQIHPQSQTHPSVIMPGQTIWGKGVVVEGETYQNILEKELSGELVQSIRVSYSSKKERPSSYFSYQKIVFDVSDLPRDIINSQHLGLWDLVDGDFK